ncbi:gustatory receptor for sugar taste 43a-like [Anoplophora glabripennis]|uniref:gustatory receptor for sugar taste 43a-like n=1 Tax=Anoplophora glabripennis TaxID=217634 RepID=UPI00087474E4|nr:gustatory receptor for sugar taste 43a-like [Anoplophora glabripennis]
MDLQDINISQENFELLQPIILVARFLGILPVRYDKHGGHFKLKMSLVYSIYSYVLTIFLTVATVLGIVNDLEKDTNHSVRMVDQKARYVTSCDISIVIIIVFFSAVTIPQKMRKLWKLLHYLNQTDSIIPLTKQSQFRQSSLFFMATTFVVAVLLFTFDIVVWTNSTTKRMKDATSFFRNYTTFYVLYLIVVIHEIFYWHLVLFIKIRISALNRYLHSIGKEDRRKKIPVQTGGRQVVVGGALENIEVCKESYKKKNFENMSLVERITVLATFQERISIAVQVLNNDGAFGIHLITLSCLLHLIVTPYFLLAEIIKPNGNVMFTYLQAAWLLAHIGRLLIIVEPCQLCLDEHRRTSMLLCELLTKDFDENVRNSLIIFSMQLNYCKIKFSPCGFFKIDRSLITSVTAAVTTYLVILFQFNTN